jgi:glutamate/tyrosine decarboxylase-like PLP-dependent enzyme
MADPLLTRTCELAAAFLASVDERPVFPSVSFSQLVAALGGPLQEGPLDPADVIEHLARAADRGLVASPGPRYFGFVTGGSVPAALAADWLTSAWDQNAGLHLLSPAAAAIEHVAAGWLLDVLRLPSSASVGFVTGATMANVAALAAARHEVLRRVGWNVEDDGLHGAPRVTLIAGADAHASIRSAARLIGLGGATIVRVDADSQGRMRPESLRAILDRATGPAIVCAQAGDVNTGAFDPLNEIEPIVHEAGAWLHVDGAFGLWAAAAPALRHLVEGAAAADSWTVDGHKWLNVPYDSGFVIVAHPAAHAAAMSQSAAYLIRAADCERDGQDWTPEASRRARGTAVYAALRSLGRNGIAAVVTRCCECARRIAERLRAAGGVEVLNDVVLNQVLVRFRDRDGGNVTPAVAAGIQRDGVCWAGGTEWQGEPALRVSVSGWKTTLEDAERSADSILRVHASLRPR